MAMEFKKSTYGSAKGILAHPDHYHAIGVTHARATADVSGLATLVGTRYVVKAGTIYPANDATAIGVVLNDIDVTDGDGNMAVVLHGFIKLSAIPAVPSADAAAAMKGIFFLPIAPFATVTLSCTKMTIDVGDTELTKTKVAVKIANAKFRPEAGTLTNNWTIAGATETKVSVSSVALSADLTTATFTLALTAAAVAGNVTVRPDADVIDINSQPAAVIIATVAAE